jgi:hypothetical protein
MTGRLRTLPGSWNKEGSKRRQSEAWCNGLSRTLAVTFGCERVVLPIDLSPASSSAGRGDNHPQHLRLESGGFWIRGRI